eukprot:7167573-Prymnesium_polylepis.1
MPLRCAHKHCTSTPAAATCWLAGRTATRARDCAFARCSEVPGQVSHARSPVPARDPLESAQRRHASRRSEHLACDVVHEGQLSEGVAGRALLHERAEALDRVVRRRRLVHPFVDVELALGDGVKVVLRRANLLVALTDDDLALGAA